MNEFEDSDKSEKHSHSYVNADISFASRKIALSCLSRARTSCPEFDGLLEHIVTDKRGVGELLLVRRQ
jgi:hypothetical protein